MAKEVKCKHCEKLKNHWCKAVLDSPDEDLTRECRHFVHKTNADRIRAMSDEELAVYLGHNSLCDRLQNDSGAWCKKHAVCKDCLVEWLKQPAEVDNA